MSFSNYINAEIPLSTVNENENGLSGRFSPGLLHQIFSKKYESEKSN